MADKRIGQLNTAPGTVDDNNTLFVVEQSGTAYKLSGAAFISALSEIMEAHGGITNISKTGTSGLTDTYTITYVDGETSTFTVRNGRGITGITWTTSGVSGQGQYHNGTISYNDGTTSTVQIRDGIKGDIGTAVYTHIRYASAQPTSNADMGTTPDNWIGIYTGTSSVAPSSYTAYVWSQFKGDTGSVGATGATPQISVGTVSTLAPGSSATVTQTGTPERPVLSFGIPSGVKGDAGDVSMSQLYAAMIEKSAEPGAVVSIPDGAKNIPIAVLRVAINPVQSGSGDPSPTNVRPITGWTACNVNVAGKNLLENINDTQTINGVTFAVLDDGSISVNGTATANTYYYFRNTGGARLPLPTDTYIMSGCPNGGSSSTYYMQINNGSWRQDNGNGVQFVCNNETYGCAIAVRSGVTANNLVFKPMIRLAADTDATYEPYHGTTTAILFGSAGTVYGGTLNATTGLLTVDRAMVDLGTLTWTRSASGNFMYTTGLASLIKRPENNRTLADILCAAAITASALDCDSASGNRIGVVADNGNVRFRYDGFSTDPTQFKSDVTGMQLVYALAVPLSYQLDPVSIRTLLGDNTIFADTGEIKELICRADPGLFITEQLKALRTMLAYVETGMTATRNYTAGEYVAVGNNLYLITENIANGGAIIIGTNAEPTTVGTRLTVLANQ